jgi:hypothetical protein
MKRPFPSPRTERFLDYFQEFAGNLPRITAVSLAKMKIVLDLIYRNTIQVGTSQEE